MIKINEDFEFERADQCWELHHWRDGTNPKTKLPTRTKTTTYHGTVLQVCRAAIDREAGVANSLQGLIEAIALSSSACESAIDRMSKGEQ